ncbi:unnamed protein product [Scytosiphon promiscuus]
MVRTSCYERVLDTETKDADDLSSALFRDAQVIDSAHEAKTFWLPANACPTTNLEAVAKAIFDFHSTSPKHLVPRKGSTNTGDRFVSRGAASEGIPSRNDDSNETRSASAHIKDGCDGCDESGAEWWVQIREEGHHADLGMPFHWDKDENMLETHGVVVCPQVSTVTYLTAYGAPTVVLEVGAPEKGAVGEGDIDRAFVSYPAPFKHLAFNGSFLHGVPQQLMRNGSHRLVQAGQDRSQSESIRVNGNSVPGNTKDSSAVLASSSARRPKERRVRATLLVNVWMSHKPAGIAPLPADIATSLTSRHRDPSVPFLLSFGRPVDFTPVPIVSRKELVHQHQEDAGVIPLGINQASEMLIDVPLGPTILLEVRAPSPGRLAAGDLKSLHSFEVLYGEGCNSRASKRKKDEAGRATDSTPSPPSAQCTSHGASADTRAWRGSHEGLSGQRRKRKHGGEA